MAPTFERKKVSSSYIPDDIAFTILSKLSIKPLNRFSCACKSWSLLFQNRNFLKMFRKNLVSKSHDHDDTCLLFNWISGPVNLSFLSGDKFEKKVKLDPPPPFHIQEQIGLRILGSSVNETLCIYDISDHKRVLLWNPTTDKVYVIPPNHLLPHGFCYHFCLHGFGYDHVRDDYKVIRHVDYNVGTWYTGYMSITPLTPDPFWEIYSLRSNSWRKLDIQIRSDGYPGGTEVYLNGVCHWLGEIEDEIFVMSFNLSNDVFFTTRVDWDGDSFLKLVVLNGYVAIISNYIYNDGSYNISISILGEIGVKESWTRLFHVGPLSQVEYPIGAGKKGNIFFRNSVGEVFWFDLTTGVFEKRDDKEKRIIGQIIVYKKNLCPIGGMNN